MRVKLKPGFSNSYVTAEKEYTVLAVYFESPIEYLIDAEGFPSAPYGARDDEFAVVDSRLSRYWEYGAPQDKTLIENGRVAILSFPEWVNNLSFFQSLVNGEKDVRSTFDAYRQKMENEFPPSSMKSIALKLSDGWIQCVECANAWQPSFSDEVVCCPSCNTKQRNPYQL